MCVELGSISEKISILGTTTPSSDTRPLASKLFPYGISVCIHSISLHNINSISNIDSFSPYVLNDPGYDIEMLMRLEFTDGHVRIEKIPINQSYPVHITAEESNSLKRILIYGKEAGKFALRLSSNKTGPFFSVVCCPFDPRFFRMFHPIKLNLDVAIGVATFTSRATMDIIYRNSDLIQTGLKITQKYGNDYVPAGWRPGTRDDHKNREWYLKIGGLWRPNDSTFTDWVIEKSFGGTGEGDYKIPIGKIYGQIHRITFNGTTVGERQTSPEKEPIYFYDVWANLAFGYFMKKCGYSPEGAAKFARKLNSFIKDDDSDQEAIKLGAALGSFEERAITGAIANKKIFFYKGTWTPLCV